MLRKNVKAQTKTTGASFAIVASKYNDEYIAPMLTIAKAELKKSGAAKIDVVRVPGAFEVIAPASKLATSGQYDAIICFGVILQGETSHAQHVGWGVTHALSQIQVEQKVPIIHGVYIFENREHARIRCVEKKHNRGYECAHTAIEMAAVMKGI